MQITICGASEHNLRQVDVELGDGLTVVTGVSGSGKTSLVFDTLYHEARRRFLEVFAPGGVRLAPAEVRSITGLGPAVAVGQNLLNRNPASTLATASGLHPFLRLLYARFGVRHCAHCGTPLSVLTEDEIVESIAELVRRVPTDAGHAGGSAVKLHPADKLHPVGVTLLAPLLRQVPGSHRTLLQLLREDFGPAALLVDGQPWDGRPLDPKEPHDLYVMVARFHPSPAQAAVDKLRPADRLRPLVAHVRAAVQTAWSLGADAVRVLPDGAPEQMLARTPVCVACGTWFGDLEPVHFRTACPSCDGRGCERCGDTGLHPEAAAVRWHGLRLPDLLARSVSQVRALFAGEMPVYQNAPAVRLRTEVSRRLDALHRVGLGYVSLDRPSPTLSRGESQRVRLAVALTSRLEDMLHVLDEPTIGQHPADVVRLLPAFRDLLGPVVYVEHDRVAAAAADRAIDLGPGAGGEGGRLIFDGTPVGLWQADTSTGRYFSLRDRVELPRSRPAPDRFLIVREASLRNLDRIDVSIPLGRLTVITGVSGSGKSTLVEDVLAASLASETPIGCRGIAGMPSGKAALKPVMVDQSPIGRNPRSNPATYTKLSDVIRDLYASATGLSPSHFSFNRPEGACPTCKGIGAVEVRMRYLPSTWIPCADCDGQRFSDEVLAATVRFGQGGDGVEMALSIADFYELSIAEVASLIALEDDGVAVRDSDVGCPPGALRHLSERSLRQARRILRALLDIGLGYLELGQPSPTLSGGEAQRVKLARFLGKRSLSSSMLILDEPSTGLHPQDVAGLLTVLDRLVRSGATVVVVEHNTDVIRAADWAIDLGPGAGPEGGRLLYAGPPEGLLKCECATGQALREESLIQPGSAGKSPVPVRAEDKAVLSIRGASANNLRNVDVDLAKGALTVVTGVSGSGKSSLVKDVLETEARRRFLESLSLYERQGTREGPEAPVESVRGLGVSVAVAPTSRLHRRRATVGTATEMTHHLANLLSWIGERRCPECARRCGWEHAPLMRRVSGRAYPEATQTHSDALYAPDARTHSDARHPHGRWLCPDCGATDRIAQPRHFHPTNYAAACLRCNGVGTLRQPSPSKLIVHPEKPLCAGAMYSPGFFPKGYLCKPFNGGYSVVQALAKRYDFDPESTPWTEMSAEAQHAFLFGDPRPLQITHVNRKGQTRTYTGRCPGFYGWIGDWDVGGTYTDTLICPECQGAKLRPEYRAVTLDGHNLHGLTTMSLSALYEVLLAVHQAHRHASAHQNAFVSADRLHPANKVRPLEETQDSDTGPGQDVSNLIAPSLQAVLCRLRFLLQVGLGYVHLDRPTSTLSAGEAQRIVLAGLLGSGLTSLTVLLDEPSRGLHPSEVDALVEALIELRDGGNTVIVVEHDLELIRAADTLIDMGPGAGVQGGTVVAQGTPAQVAEQDTVTARWLRGERRPVLRSGADAWTHSDARWMTIRGARANNLCGDDMRFPLRALVGVCGVSGSGKSTLVIDTLGRALAPVKQTTSVAYENVDPGEHDAIEGAPSRVILVDQAKKGVHSPANFLGLNRPIHELYAQGEDAQALGLDANALRQPCSACRGGGATTIDMGFMPDVRTPCEVCKGTGYRPEAWEVHLNGVALPELFSMTIDQVHVLFKGEDRLARVLAAARDVGLGYLVLRQPGYALSGGEAQRLKVCRELCRPAARETLYILDEPTVGQHLEDVARLVGVLFRLVDAGHTVLVVEHHPHVLAACDWLVELGPGGGPDGGRVIAAGPPYAVAAGDTPSAPYLREVLECVS